MRINNIFSRIVLGIIFLAIFSGLIYGTFFFWKINNTENKINVKAENEASFFDTFKNIVAPGEINLKKTESGRINILLLGVAGEGKSGKNLTDTIMIASLNAETGKVALLSIPRDLYVKVPSTSYTGKINTIYEYGLKSYSDSTTKFIDPIKEVIKDITSLDIQYWAIVNFDGFEEVVDAIGGINIMNERDIYDPRYPGPGYSYETFELSKGFHNLDGTTALKYARMRHNDPEGDFGRAKRQQQVMQAVKNKIFSTGTLLNAIALNDFLDALGSNVKTNISSQELGDFITLIKKLDTNNVNNVVLDAWNSDSLLKVSHIFYGNIRAFILVPRIGNWSEVKELAQNIFNINEIKRKRDEIAKEDASIIIINKSGNGLVAGRINKLLKDSFGYKDIIILNDSNKKLEEKTIVYDFTQGNKPFTLNELIKKLPARNASEHSDAGGPATNSDYLDTNYRKSLGNIKADMVLIIGKDLIPHYSMAEVDFKDYNEAEDNVDYLEIKN